jgi:hypothetical protein
LRASGCGSAFNFARQLPNALSRQRRNTPAATRCGATPHGALAKKPRRSARGIEVCRHLLVLICKFVGENRSRSNREETSVQEMDAYSVPRNSLIPAKNSLFLEIFSLLVCVGNYARSDCGAAVSCNEIGLGSPEIAKFPVLFPVSRELPPQTGSYLTAHTTTQSSG